MNKKINVLIPLIIGMFIGVSAGTAFSSENISYNSSTTLKSALDNIYSKVNYGNASNGDILSGKTVLVKGSKVTGSMPNLSASTPYQHNSDNTTKVVLADGDLFATNIYDTSTRTNKELYIQMRYSGTGGFINQNTLFAVNSSNFGNASISDVLKGNSFSSASNANANGSMKNLADETAYQFNSTNGTRVVVSSIVYKQTVNNTSGTSIGTYVLLRPSGGYLTPNTLVGVQYSKLRSTICS